MSAPPPSSSFDSAPTPAARVEPYQAPRPALSPIETEWVREYASRETAPVDVVPSGPGYAPAVPVKIEWPSDLQQVESDPDKVKAAEQQPVQERAVPRPKRERSPQAPVSEEPLVQIETGKPETGTEQSTTILPG